MKSAVSFFDVRDSFQDVKMPKTSTSASQALLNNLTLIPCIYIIEFAYS